MKAKNWVLTGIIAQALVLAGCTQVNNALNNAAPGEGGFVDPCQYVSCESKCDGFTYKGGGNCVLGECIYSVEEKNSAVCGYIAKPEVKIETNLKYCSYDITQKEFTLYLTMKNTGDTIVKKGSIVQLISNKLTAPQMAVLDANYAPGKMLWETTKWTVGNTGGIGGWVYYIPGAEKEIIDFTLVFCENIQCTQENWLELFNGDTNSCIGE
ncbi:MAG: hypothetical protein AB1467_02065 [Candidatus Diapherotrites archaeon]